MNDTVSPQDELKQIEAALRALSNLLSGEALAAAQQPLLEKRAALLAGSGSIVQGSQNQVVGPDGILVNGSVGGHVLGAGAVLVEGNVYIGPPPRHAGEALAIYRRVVAQIAANLPLRGVDVGAADPTAGQKPIGLANVYIALDTKSQVEDAKAEGSRGRKAKANPDESPDWQAAFGEQRSYPLPALQAVIQNPRLVLLGDPGSGKSTFVNFLTHCLASQNLTALPGWPAEAADCLPVPVILRDFARSLPGQLPRPAEPAHLSGFIAERLNAQNLAFAVEPLNEQLEQGRALLLFDGLDEVPGTAQRAFVRDAVLAFLARYPVCRCLVTCRVLSYQPPRTPQEPDLRLADFPSCELAPFDDDKIDHFIGAWHHELARLGTVSAAEADGLSQHLNSAVRRPDLWRLASNPLLLTVMALVHTHKGRLPDARALLYEDTVDILLWRWEQIKAGGQTAAPPLRQLLLEAGCSEVDLKRVLWRLAYEAHAQLEPDSDGEKLAGIHEHRLLKALAELKCSDLNWGQAVADAMKQRAGLLLERAPEVFTFPHRTFQEYLAGAHLASQANFACRAAELAGQGAQWQEVILLAVGRLMYVAGDLDKPLALAGELCPSQPLPADPPAWRKAWLAGSVLLETGLARVQSSALGRDLLERLRLRLADLLAQGALAPGERARAGDTLAELGDPRFDPERWCLPKDDTLGFIEIPAGPFVMGTKHGTIPGLVQQYGGQRDWYEPETPQHTLNLAGYWLAKYPVTVAQYAAFMAAGGYAEPRYWPEAQAARCWSNGQFEGRYDPAPRIRPGDYGEPFSQPNRPVVGVTWYEALAYSRWLDEQLRAYSRTLQATSIFWQKLAAGELRITLPSEAEWEMAARDGDGREYPWGAKFDPHLTNTSEAGPGATSAVGCFPGGAGPYGALDLSGNVWEWTRSVFAKYPYQPDATREDLKAGSDRSRVVRGGSWRYHQRFARCAYRLGYYPLYRHRDVGFRLVAVRPL